jgi:hypothetical protein
MSKETDHEMAKALARKQGERAGKAGCELIIPYSVPELAAAYEAGWKSTYRLTGRWFKS